MPDDQRPEAPVQRQPVRRKVDPASDSALATLLTSYHEAKERAAAAAEEAEEYKSQITSLIIQYGEADAYDITGDPYGGYPAFSYTLTPEGWGLDSKTMKSEDPETWVKFAKKRAAYWTLKEKSTGRRPKR